MVLAPSRKFSLESEVTSDNLRPHPYKDKIITRESAKHMAINARKSVAQEIPLLSSTALHIDRQWARSNSFRPKFSNCKALWFIAV